MRGRLPLTAEEASERLEVTRQAMFMMESRGRIRRVTSYPRVGYDPLDIERILQSRPSAPRLLGHWSER